MYKMTIHSAAYIASIHFRLQRRTHHACIIFIAVFLLGLTTALPYQSRLIAENQSISIGEIEGIVITPYAVYAAILYLYLISDIPLDSGFRYFTVTRSGQTQYLLGCELYILFSAMMFMILPRCAALLVVSPNLVITLQWSTFSIDLLNLYKTPEISPLVASISSYLRGVLYCVVLGNVLMIGNICLKEKYGFLLSTYLHGFFWAMTLDGIWGRWTLFQSSLFSLNFRADIVTIMIDIMLILSMFFAMNSFLVKHNRHHNLVSLIGI